MYDHGDGDGGIRGAGRSLYYILPLLVGGHVLSVWLGFRVGQVVLGLAVIGYIPGALAIRLLFQATSELGTLERFVLSIVTSFMLCTSLGLLLNLLPQGLSSNSIYLAVWGVITVLFLLNIWSYRHHTSESVSIRDLAANLAERVTTQYAKQELAAYFVAGVAAALCLSLLVFLTMSAESDETFTEFYLLSLEGLAQGYSQGAAVGQPLTVTVGIANQEAVPSDYQVYVISDELLIGESGLVHLEPGATDERPVSFTPLAAGDDVEVLFYLYRDEGEGPYRFLRLWLQVTETG
jgi:uncharacterized membrane protein